MCSVHYTLGACMTLASVLALNAIAATPARLQYPIYHPSREEQQDPALYASNVRKYMVSSPDP